MALVAWIVPSVVAIVVAWAAHKQGDGPGPVADPSHAIYVIGDLHGDAACARHWVNRTGLVVGDSNDDRRVWTDPTSRLVFVGDYIDKGPTSREVVELVKGLTEDFPQYVTALLGNHEMELLLDRDTDRWSVWGGAGFHGLAYASVHPGEYLNYLARKPTEDDKMVVQALYNASVDIYGRGLHQSVYIAPLDRVGESSILHFIPQNIRPLVAERLAEFQNEYLNSYRSNTELGSWIESRPIIAKLNDTVFVHGGISSRASKLIASKGIEGINKLFAENSNEDKLHNFIEQTEAGQVIYDLLTFRGNHQDGACPYLPHLLPEGAARLGVGHTPADSVRLLCEGNFLALDSALGRWFRNSGNEYCPGHESRLSSNGHYTCGEINDYCEGQIIRITDGGIEMIG